MKGGRLMVGKKTVHISFSKEFEKTLKSVFGAGIDVISIHDNLAYGPLDQIDTISGIKKRTKWLQNYSNHFNKVKLEGYKELRIIAEENVRFLLWMTPSIKDQIALRFLNDYMQKVEKTLEFVYIDQIKEDENRMLYFDDLKDIPTKYIEHFYKNSSYSIKDDCSLSLRSEWNNLLESGDYLRYSENNLIKTTSLQEVENEILMAGEILGFHEKVILKDELIAHVLYKSKISMDSNFILATIQKLFEEQLLITTKTANLKHLKYNEENKKLWYNGIIHTMEDEETTVEAVLTSKGSIIQSGTYKELFRSADIKIDLQGKVVYPGFVDSHLHMIGVGQQLIRVDLSNIISIEQLIEKMKEASENCRESAWLIGDGLDENNFKQPILPTKWDLDEIRQKPVIISRVCRHIYMGNSAALEAADLVSYADHAKGRVGRNAAGELNGIVYEAAAEQLRNASIATGENHLKELQNALNLSIDELQSKGLTGGHTEDMNYYGPYQDTYAVYKKVTSERQDFKCNLLIHHEVFEAMMSEKFTFDEQFMELGAMKIFADGSLGGETAALQENYTSKPGWKGMLIHSDEQMRQLFELANAYNRPVAIHTIGDAALEQIISLLEKFDFEQPLPHRIIHASIVNEELIERMKKLPIAVDIQPTFITSDGPWIEQKIGADRANYAYAIKSLMQAGITCAGGSDGPVESVDPLEGIYAATNRLVNEREFVVAEQVSTYEAVKMYTTEAAKIIGHESTRGMVKVGYDADFTIFDRDLSSGDVRDAIVEMTVVNGKVVYKKDLM